MYIYIYIDIHTIQVWFMHSRLHIIIKASSRYTPPSISVYASPFARRSLYLHPCNVKFYFNN